MQDIPRAVEYWLRSRKWLVAKALCARLEANQQQFQHEVKSKVLEAAQERKEHFITLREEVTERFSRWKEVKAIKAKKLLDGVGENMDNFSEVDSMSSYSSRSGSSVSG